MGVLEPVIMDLLTESVYVYLAYGERALEILEKLKAMQERLPRTSRPERVERFRGRDVVFPTRLYPRFFMGVLAADVLTPSNWHWAFDLRGVSSDPDRSGVPTTLALSLTESRTETGDRLSRSAAFNGQADFRSNANERFNAEFTAGGFPVSISGGSGLGRVGIGGFSGGASFGLNAVGRAGGGFSGGGNISFVQASLTNPSNTFAQAADEAIRHVGSVELGINYEHVVAGRDRFSVSTNFDDIFMEALRRIVNQYRRQAEEAIERALRAKIEQYIDDRFVSKEDLDALFRLVRGDKDAVDELRNILDRKRNELETRLRSVAEDAARQATDAAREQAQQAVQDVLQGQRPQAPTLPAAPSSLPSIPSIPRR
jgi:hypothetical protein